MVCNCAAPGRTTWWLNIIFVKLWFLLFCSGQLLSYPMVCCHIVKVWRFNGVKLTSWTAAVVNVFFFFTLSPEQYSGIENVKGMTQELNLKCSNYEPIWRWLSEQKVVFVNCFRNLLFVHIFLVLLILQIFFQLKQSWIKPERGFDVSRFFFSYFLL